jgi:hypothetical protein
LVAISCSSIRLKRTYNSREALLDEAIARGFDESALRAEERRAGRLGAASVT